MSIDFSITGSIAHIELNRPEKRNALSDSMIGQLGNLLERSTLKDGAAIVLISARGVDFCAGMDLAEASETADAGVEKHLESAARLANLFRSIRYHPQPVVAAVHGRALGGGCGLATACDVVLAAESAQFGYPEVKIGFVPAIVTSILRRSVGEKRAFNLLAGGDPIDAREAREIGLITRVYADADFNAGVQAFVADLASKPTSAVSLTKRLLYNIDGMPFDAAIDAGVQMNALARMTGDARQGFQRFAKKSNEP